MFQVPEQYLKKLKCSLCDGYLNASPVVVNKENQQICSKCYKILPKIEKEQCLRQIAFEAIGSCLIFPCRYHQMGCEYIFTWNNENGHEAECKKRYFTVPDLVAIKTSDQKNKISVGCASILTDIQHDNICQSIDMTKISTSSINGKINAHNHLVYENIYSTISNGEKPTRSFNCFNCKLSVDESSRHRCLFGHISCDNCKSDMCIACVKNLDGTSKIACKNASKGCKELLFQSDVGFHRDNCEFNEIICPFDECGQKYTLHQLVDHLKKNHAKNVILSNEVSQIMSRKDKNLVLICHDGIFKCLYFYYITFIEIIVLYLGSCEKASEFCYEISTEVNTEIIRKKSVCSNWNNYTISKGIVINENDLKAKGAKGIKFRMNLKILRIK